MQGSAAFHGLDRRVMILAVLKVREVEIMFQNMWWAVPEYRVFLQAALRYVYKRISHVDNV